MAGKNDSSKKTKKSRKITALKESMTKSEIIKEIAERTELTRKQISHVFDEMAVIIERHIKKRSVQQFILPGLMKVEVKRKPAVKARKGNNPFTGEEMTFKARPAHNVVKIRPLKKLKDMVL